MKQKTISDLAHNPLNIRATNDVWKGQRGQFKGFVDFVDDIYGYRAAVKILLGYIGDGFVTPRAIISKWAPVTENDVEAYLSRVCNSTISTLRADEPICSRWQFRELIYMMTFVERGKAGDFALINKGYALALKALTRKQTMGLNTLTENETMKFLDKV